MTPPPTLPARFRAALADLGIGAEARVLVALSGGIDSVVLLHLLRFAVPDLDLRLTAAHFDHAMRPDSAADARWVSGLCRAWGVPLYSGRAAEVLRSEAEAREARYRFLRETKTRAGATHLATAHHADDQAETVLFRVLRGTGIAGLAGIPARGEDGLVRPLLPFWRREIRRYARLHGIRWREDPSNETPGPARNRIRHTLLPRIEKTLAPGARRSLVRLAEAAREEEAAWEGVLREKTAAAARDEGGGAVLVRETLAGYDTPVAARVLRNVLRRFGIVLDRTGTRSALQFITAAPSGRSLLLPGGRMRLVTEFGLARLEPVEEPPPPDLALLIEGAAGEGTLRVGGREVRVAWRTAPPDARDDPRTLVLAPDDLRLPLVFRGWAPGDRLRTAAGTRTLKKLFGEARTPRRARSRTPVLADAGGRVVWAAGVARAAFPPPRAGEHALIITIADA